MSDTPTNVLHVLADYLHSIPDDHPVHISLRTYALSLSLSLGPALLPFLTSSKARSGGLKALRNVLQRELGLASFASSMTVGVGGGAALKLFWDEWSERYAQQKSSSKESESPLLRWWQKIAAWLASLDDVHRSFISNIISSYLAIRLLQSRRRLSRSAPPRAPIPMTALTTSTPAKPSFTLDLTLLFAVRAVDCLVRSKLFPSPEDVRRDQRERVRKKRQDITTKLDAFIFWASSARSVYAQVFHYAYMGLIGRKQNYVVFLLPTRNVCHNVYLTEHFELTLLQLRLPRSYNKW